MVYENLGQIPETRPGCASMQSHQHFCVSVHFFKGSIKSTVVVLNPSIRKHARHFRLIGLADVRVGLAQRAQDVYTTSHQRRCNVVTLHRRSYDVVSTLRAHWGFRSHIDARQVGFYP